MSHKISVAHLKAVAKGKPSGYVEDVIAHGKVEGNTLFVQDADYVTLQKKYALPSLKTQIKNVFSATGKALMNPRPLSSEERERRLSICHECEFLIDGKRCQKCGCHVNWKSRLEAWHCPIQKW